jgi:hypothetical protein
MLQLSAKSTGLFESFYSQLKPIIMIKEQKDIAGEGRVTDRELNEKGEKKFPFSFVLKVLHSAHLIILSTSRLLFGLENLIYHYAARFQCRRKTL